MFSGVEGFGLGIPDGEPVGFSEIDKFASAVLKYHFSHVKNYGNCTDIKWNEVPDFDLLTGGSPCQDFSIAGKRKGLQGPRSSLAWEYIRCLRSKKPKYFIWENVAGALSSRGGWDIANIITAFSESGYALWWQVLNAKDFGVPQNRERIFVCGFREGSPKEIFFKSENTKSAEIMGTTKGDENTRIGERDTVYGEGGVMGSLKATDYKQPPQILVKNKGESQHYRLYDTEGLAPTLQSQSGMSSQKHPFIQTVGLLKESEKPKGNYLPRERVLDSKGGARAVSTHESQMPFYEQMGKVRKLMPIECERLMSWPDDWTRYGIDEKENKVEISDNQRYKMCGNGVVSNVIKEIVKNLL